MAGEKPPVAEDPSWKDGRLVLRRPEIPDSELARMNVPLTRARRHVLGDIVTQMIQEKREQADVQLTAELKRAYPGRKRSKRR